jgi:hypothetical protein
MVFLVRFQRKETDSSENWGLCLQSPEERGFFIQILESAYRFTLGSIGGGKLMPTCILYDL